MMAYTQDQKATQAQKTARRAMATSALDCARSAEAMPLPHTPTEVELLATIVSLRNVIVHLENELESRGL